MNIVRGIYILFSWKVLLLWKKECNYIFVNKWLTLRIKRSVAQNFEIPNTTKLYTSKQLMANLILYIYFLTTVKKILPQKTNKSCCCFTLILVRALYPVYMLTFKFVVSWNSYKMQMAGIHCTFLYTSGLDVYTWAFHS